VESDDSLGAKPPWDKVKLSGKVEGGFLYASSIGTDIVPFGMLRARPLLVPATMENGKLTMFASASEIFRAGFEGLADYLRRAEELWEKKAMAKSRKMSVFERLDYERGLTSQKPSVKFKVLYSASGTNVTACIVDQSKEFESEGVRLKGFIADKKTYWYDTDHGGEAYYLCGLLNSSLVNETIKPLQTRGLFGERDIHKRPLLLPIPHFSARNAKHARLAELGKLCTEKVKEVLKGKGPQSRSAVRGMLAKEIAEIDDLAMDVIFQENKPNTLLEYMAT